MGQRKKSRDQSTCAPSHDDRRIDQRHDARALGPVVARLVGGSEVRLIDFARRGVLLESDTRLLIGAKATIKITTTDTTISVRGQVVRSRVAGVKGGALMYHTAMALEEELGLADSVAPRQTSEPVFEEPRSPTIWPIRPISSSLDRNVHYRRRLSPAPTRRPNPCWSF